MQLPVFFEIVHKDVVDELAEVLVEDILIKRVTVGIGPVRDGVHVILRGTASGPMHPTAFGAVKWIILAVATVSTLCSAPFGKRNLTCHNRAWGCFSDFRGGQYYRSPTDRAPRPYRRDGGGYEGA
jgi:hypothetical protein